MARDSSDLLSCNSANQNSEVSPWTRNHVSMGLCFCLLAIFPVSPFLGSWPHPFITVACLCGHISFSDWFFFLSLTKTLEVILSCAHPPVPQRHLISIAWTYSIASAEPFVVQGNTLRASRDESTDIIGTISMKIWYLWYDIYQYDIYPKAWAEKNILEALVIYISAGWWKWKVNVKTNVPTKITCWYLILLLSRMVVSFSDHSVCVCVWGDHLQLRTVLLGQ